MNYLQCLVEKIHCGQTVIFENNCVVTMSEYQLLKNL